MSRENALRAQVEMGTQLAVISEQLRQLPDHESRLRALERFRFTLLGVATIGGWRQDSSAT